MQTNATLSIKPPYRDSESLPQQKSERMSTHGDDTANMFEDMAEKIIVQLRRWAIRELAGNALQLVVRQGNMSFEFLRSALKNTALQWDKSLHEGKNLHEDDLSQIATVVGLEMF